MKSTTLNLVDRLLALGRNYQHVHRNHEAVQAFGRLAGLRELPPAVAEEAQARLAELHIERKKLRKARRHLTAALLYRPDSARYHYLMATTLDTRREGDWPRAAEHYRKSLELDPNQPQCRCALGLTLLRMGQVAGALDALRQAAEQAPDDPAVLTKVIKGLRLADQSVEARRLLLAARFRNPRDGRFGRLYNDFMFRQLRKEQTAARLRRTDLTDTDGPVLLAFVRPERETAPVEAEQKLIRLDQAAPPSAPHSPARPARRTDWKHG
jgi:Flp pilus assembly protein TadD